jgi:hypothetical protein
MILYEFVGFLLIRIITKKHMVCQVFSVFILFFFFFSMLLLDVWEVLLLEIIFDKL